MKKILVLLLVLCTVLTSAVIALPVSAESNGPSQDYAALYVSDGLVMNFLSSSGVDLSAGTWTSLDGGKQVKLLGGNVWQITEDGALTFHLADNDMNVGIDLGIENLPSGSFTVETVARGIGYTQNADGVTPALTTALYGKQVGPSFVYGPLKGEGFPMERDPDPTHYDGESNYKYGNDYAYNNVRWYYSEAKLGWQQTASKYGYFGFAWENGWKYTGKTVSYVVTHTRTTSSSQYSVVFNGATLAKFSVPMSFQGKPIPFIDKADDQEFVMFRSFPAEIYAIRVYDRALSAAEIDRNHFADVASHFRLDISAFATMSEARKSNLYSMFRNVSLNDEKADVESVMKAAFSGGDSFDVANSLYATDGLRAMFLSFDVAKDSMLISKNNSLWIDVVNGNVGELRGKKWERKEHGGVSYSATYSEWLQEHNFGLYFDIGLLPDGEFTVESVVNPIGATNEDGTRYVDSKNVYGTYVDNVFAFGPLKAMSFICPYANDPNRLFEHRWVYVASGCWAAAGYKQLLSETGFTHSDGVHAIQFDVSHEYKEYESASTKSQYYFYSDFMNVGILDRTGAIIPKDETDGIFCIEGSMPGEIYAVRIYDRRLTAVEMMQNHVADLVYYYDLDPTLFLQMMKIAEDPRSVLELFSDMSFDLSREEAKTEFNNLLCGLCIRADGIAARLDGKVGLRGVFTLDLDMIRALEAQGYDVSVAARILIGEDETTVFVYEDGAKKQAFFLDEDTFAAAVRFQNPDASLMMQDIRFAYAVTLTLPDGGSVALSGDLTTKDDLDSAFAVYNDLSRGSYAKNAFIRRTVDICYTLTTLNVGGEGAFATVAEAMAEALHLLGEATLPLSVEIRLGDGVYRVSQPIAIDGSTIGNPYSRLALTGGSADDVTVTGAAVIDGADFAPVSGTGYYVYRFEKDGDGNYPEFRAFFANGDLATLAHSGETRYDSGLQHTLPCEMGFSADGSTAANKFYIHEELIPDLDVAGAELHVQAQWDFNIIHITRVDVSDRTTDDDGNPCVAVYFDETERAAFSIPGGYKLKGREYWLENAKSFLDEPGEYYYDRETGELYYYPKAGMDLASATLEYAVTDQLFVCDNVCNFTVSGITFTGTDDLFLSRYGHTGGQAGSDSRTRAYYDASGSFPERAAFLFRGKTSYLTVEECIFRELSCEGITMRGRIEHAKIESCRFFDIGATAIRMAEGSAAWNDKCGLLDVTVSNNYIDNTGWSIRQCCATQFGSAKDLLVEYNTILHSSYTAISIGWHWSTYAGGTNLRNVNVGNNYIASFMTDMKDGGAIYTLGANAPDADTERFNAVYQNYIVFTKDTGCRGMVVGIYHDGSSSNWYDSGNVIVCASAVNDRLAPSEYYYYYSQTIDGQISHNNTAEDNYFVNLTAKNEDDRLKEAFRSTLNREYQDRGIVVEPNELFCGLDEFWDSDAPYFVENVGSEFCIPDVEEIRGNDY